MQSRNNPYTPGAGEQPPLLAGRAAELSLFDQTIARVTDRGRHARPWIITGLRGVGKTVLLNEMTRRASAAGWICMRIEAEPTRPLAAQIARGLHGPLRKAAPKKDAISRALLSALGVFKAFHVTVDPAGRYGFGFDFAAEAGHADSGDLSHDLQDLVTAIGEAARADGTGVFLAVDELQAAPRDDIHALNFALHQLGQAAESVPYFFIGAGLPSLPAVLADATSYAERLYAFDHVLHMLDEASTRDALALPALGVGVTWDDDALDAAWQLTGGFPYLVQTLGRHSWDAATGDRIDLTAVDAGKDGARREATAGLYQSRWDLSSPSQRRLLAAVARTGDRPVAMRDLVPLMGKRRVSDLSATRDELIRRGVIYAPERGFVQFTVPGMAEFVTSQD